MRWMFSLISAALMWTAAWLNHPYVFVLFLGLFVLSIRRRPFFWNRLSSSLLICELKEDLLLKFLGSIALFGPLKKLQKRISTRVEHEIQTAGTVANPDVLGTKSVLYPVLASCIVVPLVLFAILADSSVFLVFLAVPPVLFVLPSLQLKVAASERSKRITDELAFFAAYCSIMQSVGRPLYHSLLEILDNEIFYVLKREAQMIKRNVEVFAMDPVSAINDLALSHPNRPFSNFLLAYVSIHKSGGDLAAYLERKTEEFFASMRFQLSQYVGRASTIAEAMLIMLSILPVLLSASQSLPAISLASLVLVPSITLALVVVINSSQPRTLNSVQFNVYGIFASAGTVVLGMVWGFEVWETFLLAAFCGTLPNSFTVFGQMQRISKLEEALPDFLRDVTENVKIGLSIPASLIRLRTRHYNAPFDSLLSAIVARLLFGSRLSDAIAVPQPSWNVQMAFFVLGRLADSGGVRPQTLEYITNFVFRTHQAKKELLSGLKIFVVMVYLSPILMVWITETMDSVLEDFGSLSRIDSPSISSVSLTEILVSASSVCMAVVITKLAYFTLKNTVPVTVSSIITLAVLELASYLPVPG